MPLLFFKTLHIIFAISWFVGLFYGVRLLIYYKEAQLLNDGVKREILTAEYARIMGLLSRIILKPAMIGTLLFGGAMIMYNSGYLEQVWLIIKLLFVVLLFLYHTYLTTIISQLNSETIKIPSSLYLRFFNEIATVLLAGIVALAVFKSTINIRYLAVTLAAFTLQLYVMVKKVNKKLS